MLHSPLPTDIRKLRVNKTLHGRSVHRTKDVPGHNVVKGYKARNGDAVDLFCMAGTPVYAMHSGRVSRVFDRAGVLSGCYIDDGSEWTTVYAHLSLKDYVVLGAKITEGQIIGYVGRKLKDPHLHLEVWHKGSSASASTSHDLRTKIGHLIYA